ncbi:hypothetical protein [Alkalihalobacillus sp. 1P02AB]|uniref:hypothetical protein n=1 Tax=Alkalihalobacillus sp. 1P02AB TaxID=3132260 RepID=UPI0039A41231
MKKSFTFLLIAFLLPLAACQVDSESQIIEDSQKNERPLGFQGVASDKDQNRRKGLADEQMMIYADKSGQYLSNVISYLENHAFFFENPNNETEALQSFQQALAEIRSQTVELINTERPKTFNGFHEIHLSLLVELDVLDRILMDMRAPIDEKQYHSARVHYENAIISYKSLEREWFSITEEYGIY